MEQTTKQSDISIMTRFILVSAGCAIGLGNSLEISVRLRTIWRSFSAPLPLLSGFAGTAHSDANLPSAAAATAALRRR